MVIIIIELCNQLSIYREINKDSKKERLESTFANPKLIENKFNGLTHLI